MEILVSERSQLLKTAYCKILFIWNFFLKKFLDNTFLVFSLFSFFLRMMNLSCTLALSFVLYLFPLKLYLFTQQDLILVHLLCFKCLVFLIIKVTHGHYKNSDFTGSWNDFFHSSPPQIITINSLSIFFQKFFSLNILIIDLFSKELLILVLAT